MPQWKRNLYVMCVAQVVANLGFSAVFPFMALYVRKLGVNDNGPAALWTGLLSAGTSIAAVLMAPVWGTLSDRYGRKMMVQRALFANVFVIGSMAFVQNVEQLFVLRVLMGALGGFAPAATALVSSTSPDENLGYALGLVQMCTYVGSAMGPLVGGFIADRLGFRPVFVITGTLCLVVGTLVLLLVKENFKRPLAVAGKKESALGSLGKLITRKEVAIMALVIFMINFATVVISPIFPLFLEEAGAAEDNVATMAGLIIGLGAMISAMSSVNIARYSDRLGQRRILIVCSVGAAAAYLLQSFAGQVWHLFALRVPIGIFLGGLMPVANIVISRVTLPEERGRVFGLTSSATSLASAVGPLAGGGIAAAFGLRAVFVVTSSVLFATSAVIISQVRNPEHQFANRRPVREALDRG